jgi:hypothetical protein
MPGIEFPERTNTIEETFAPARRRFVTHHRNRAQLRRRGPLASRSGLPHNRLPLGH